MKLQRCSVKSVKADLAKGEITLAFVVPMEYQAEVTKLAHSGDETYTLDVHPWQHPLPMFDMGNKLSGQGQGQDSARPEKIKADPETGEVEE